MSSITTSAANGIQAKIDKLRAVYYTGTYFTKSGGPCYDWSGADCSLENIPSRGGLPAGSTVSKAIGNGWSCNGFARYAFYYVFGKNFRTSTIATKPSLGDILETYDGKYTHYSMYLSEDTYNYYVYDSNGTGDCSVRYNGKLPKSKYTIVKIYHASNYDSINGSSTPAPSINYVKNLAGEYYLKSKSTGTWLSVKDNKNASTQPIITSALQTESFRVKLTAKDNGYKMNFPGVSSYLVNPYSDTPTVGTKINLYKDVNDNSQWWGFEKVGDAYVIRCLYNPSLVLTDNGLGNQATLTTYTGASNQLWYLQPYSASINFSIKEPSTKTIRYKDGIVLHINGNIPSNAKMKWSVDGNEFKIKDSDNKSCLLVSQNDGYATVVATLYDSNNKVIGTTSIELHSKAGFFDKFGGFFRVLFGTTKIHDAYK